MIRRVSIITVACNSVKGIIPTMESVLAQELGQTELEYRIIDGNSTDGTAETARWKKKGFCMTL